MLLRVQTLLDDLDSEYWTEADIYRALTDGQQTVITFLLSVFKIKSAQNIYENVPEVLRPLLTTQSGATQTDTLPADFLDILSCKVNGSEPAYQRSKNKINHFDKADTYMTGNYFALIGSQIVFEDTITSYDFDYIKKPSDITAVVNPTLHTIAHIPITQYAYADLLRKDEKIEQAISQLNIFNQMMQTIYI